MTPYVLCHPPRPSLATAAGDSARAMHQYEEAKDVCQGIGFVVAKLKHTFNRIVVYLDQAFAYAAPRVPSKLWVPLLYESRSESWAKASIQGSDGPIPFAVPLRSLGRKYKVDHKSFGALADNLILARIISPLGAGLFRINKEYRDWVYPGTDRPLLEPDELDVIDDLKRLAGVGSPLPTGEPTPQASYNDCIPVGSPLPRGGEPTPQFHNISNRAFKSFKERALSGDSRAEGCRRADPEPPPGPPESASTKAEIEALRIWADRHCPDLSYWATEQASIHPAPWIQALLAAKAVGAKPTPRIPYLVSILRDWHAKGACEYLQPKADGPKPESKAQRKARELKEGFARMKERNLERLKAEGFVDGQG